MPGSTPARLVVLAVALVAVLFGYRWWTSPERQIHRLLGDVASALSHEQAEADLRAIAAVAALQRHLAPDVTLEAGALGPPLRGRQDVTAMAARVRASRPMMRVQFFDAVIERTGDSAADVRVTAQVTTRDEAGEEVADAHEVSMTLLQSDGRWLVARAEILTGGGPPQ
jgi:ketosteroid isomerase-like protein